MNNIFNSLTKVNRLYFSQIQLLKTSLNEYHKTKLNGKMVEFAGYEMPVQYPEGVLKEHLHTRQSSSLFDVSHMGQIKIYGKDSVDFIEKLVVGDIRGKKEQEGFLSLILNEKAGIIDDTIVTKFENHIHMVVNGANKFIDLEHMQKLKEQYFPKADIKIQYEDQKSLIAIQGPKTEEVFQQLTNVDLSKILFMQHQKIQLKNGLEVLACRCGYTGEDGFELSIENDKIVQLTDLLLQNPLMKPAGLGARDSLRLEAGLCLHGHDMNDQITPAEATLLWTVRKQSKEEKQCFLGNDVLAKQRKEGVKQKRVGFLIKGSGILRPVCDVFDQNKNKVGYVCSGTYSPMLKKGIGMMYVSTSLSSVGQELIVNQKGKDYPIQIVKMPFVEAKYKRA